MYDILGNSIYVGCRVVYNNILNEFEVGIVNAIKGDKIQVKGNKGILFFVTDRQIISADRILGYNI